MIEFVMLNLPAAGKLYSASLLKEILVFRFRVFQRNAFGKARNDNFETTS